MIRRPFVAAFTLVELSIVLVILGLLVGGVLAGQSLIHAAELRAVSTEYTNYKTALNAFKEKYMALPGDMNNAVRFWGAQAGGTADGVDATCEALDSSSPATGTATCNGDGDGMINEMVAFEGYRLWQHLANAGLIEGTYTGVEDSGYAGTPGENLPRSRYPNAGWGVDYVPAFGTGSAWWFAGSYGNVLIIGAKGAEYPNMPLFTPPDAYNIDAKLDDGKPGSGVIRTWKYALFRECPLADNSAYALDRTEAKCFLFMRSGH